MGFGEESPETLERRRRMAEMQGQTGEEFKGNYKLPPVDLTKIAPGGFQMPTGDPTEQINESFGRPGARKGGPLPVATLPDGSPLVAPGTGEAMDRARGLNPLTARDIKTPLNPEAFDPAAFSGGGYLGNAIANYATKSVGTAQRMMGGPEKDIIAMMKSPEINKAVTTLAQDMNQDPFTTIQDPMVQEALCAQSQGPINQATMPMPSPGGGGPGGGGGGWNSVMANMGMQGGQTPLWMQMPPPQITLTPGGGQMVDTSARDAWQREMIRSMNPMLARNLDIDEQKAKAEMLRSQAEMQKATGKLSPEAERQGLFAEAIKQNPALLKDPRIKKRAGLDLTPEEEIREAAGMGTEGEITPLQALKTPLPMKKLLGGPQGAQLKAMYENLSQGYGHDDWWLTKLAQGIDPSMDEQAKIARGISRAPEEDRAALQRLVNEMTQPSP